MEPDNVVRIENEQQKQKQPTLEQQAFALLTQLAAVKYNEMIIALERKVNS